MLIDTCLIQMKWYNLNGCSSDIGAFVLRGREKTICKAISFSTASCTTFFSPTFIASTFSTPKHSVEAFFPYDNNRQHILYPTLMFVLFKYCLFSIFSSKGAINRSRDWRTWRYINDLIPEKDHMGVNIKGAQKCLVTAPIVPNINEHILTQ